MRLIAAASGLALGVASAVFARPVVVPVMSQQGGAHWAIGENAALLKLAAPDHQGIAVFAYPSALGKSGLFGARLPGVLPVLEQAWPIPETPNLAVDSLIATNRAGMVAYRSSIQFQAEQSIVIAGPIRGPMNTGTVRVIPLWSFVDVTDPAIDEEGMVYFGARGDDGLSRLWRIAPNENGPTVYLSYWNFLETIRAVAFDSSCGTGHPGALCTIAALFERNVGPAVFHMVWAADLDLDIAPVVAGPFPPWMRGLDTAGGEVSIVECNPGDVGSGRVLTVIENYQAVSPPRVTAEAIVNAANVNRMQNFCGVRVVPHYPGGDCPPVIGGTGEALFLTVQTCDTCPLTATGIGVGRPLLGSTIEALATNPRAINNRGDVVFSVRLVNGSSWLMYMPSLRTSCRGDSDCNLVVNFADITAALGNFGVMYPPDGFCMPLGDADFDRAVTFGDVTAILGEWGRDCR